MPALEILAITTIVAAACALLGVFLVLRRAALLGDAISHAILPGLVVGFLVTGRLSSPWLVVAAAATGVLTVALIERLARTRLVKQDAAIGLVFPALFSVGVILIARYAGDVHLDTDAVLLGDPAFAWIERFRVGGRDLGPMALWQMGGVLCLNGVFILLFYKELKLTTFDPALAAAFGFAPTVVHYGLMTLVSITAVGAFDVVGSVLVVALMVGPAAAAYLLTDRLPRLLALSVAYGVAAAALGYALARALDASIAGAMATMVGVLFGATYLLAPQRGLVAQARRRTAQRLAFAQTMLTIHLLHHEYTPDADRECHADHLQEHLRWSPVFANLTLRHAQRAGLVLQHGDHLALTPAGRQHAQTAMVA